jgi:hypothetical protein
MRFSEQEKEELRAVASSASMRADSQRLLAGRNIPFMKGGIVDCDLVVEFLTKYNEFLNNPIKSRWSFVEKEMKL